MTSISRDAFKWNCALRGLLQSNAPQKAIFGYAYLKRRFVVVDGHTISLVIKACGLLIPGVNEGEQTHSHVLKMGFGSEVVIQTALLKMYGTFGALVSAQKVFDETPHRDLVQWNALVTSYAQSKHAREAILVTGNMFSENVRPNEVTAVSFASACSQLKAIRQGKLLHGYVLKTLFGFDTILYNALIDMYAKCACLSSACRLFWAMRCRNSVCWTSMINAYCDHHSPHEALALFKEMEAARIIPDEVTMLGVVSMCAKIGDSELGNWVDEYIERKGFKGSIKVENALVDMHGKCGNIEKACRTFQLIKTRTLISWTAMIQVLALHGRGVEALVRFAQMQREEFRPDEVVFLNVLNACSHAGLVMEGMQCFKSMVDEHGIEPWIEHYGSMVDLLCKAGLIKDAVQFVLRMPIEPDAVIWRALVGACKGRGYEDFAREAVSKLLDLDPDHRGNYVLKSNLYALVGDWEVVKEVRDDMDIQGVNKRDSGSSLIEANSE